MIFFFPFYHTNYSTKSSRKVHQYLNFIKMNTLTFLFYPGFCLKWTFHCISYHRLHLQFWNCSEISILSKQINGSIYIYIYIYISTHQIYNQECWHYFYFYKCIIFFLLICQACNKKSPLGQAKSGLIRQVTS
jgi:hypothetical protein